MPDLKGNNGRAAKKKLLQNIMIIIGTTVGVIGLFEIIIGSTSSKSTSASTSLESSSRFFKNNRRMNNYNHFEDPNENLRNEWQLPPDQRHTGRFNHLYAEKVKLPRSYREQHGVMANHRKNRHGGGNYPDPHYRYRQDFEQHQSEEEKEESRGFFGFMKNKRKPILPPYAKGMSDEELVLSATVHLVNLDMPRGYIPTEDEEDGQYSSTEIYGMFCHLDWNLHKTNPAEHPMNRDLIRKSPHCKNMISLPLRPLVEKAKAYDAKFSQNYTKSTTYDETKLYPPHVLPPAGFVFHESRCGSTLAANALAFSDAEHNRVFSESQPPIQVIMNCADTEHYSDCDKEVTLSLLRDVVYMMGRTQSPIETRLFYKIQSMGTAHMRVMLDAFPHTPWIYVYRDPVQVMMSHFDAEAGKKARTCLRHQHDPPLGVRKLVFDLGEDINDMSQEDYCAAHLASLCQSALTEYQRRDNGLLVNYNKLPAAFYDTIFPHHFHMPLTEEGKQKIIQVSGLYSKQKNKMKPKFFSGDNEKKEKRATPAIVDASDFYMKPIYDKIEDIVASEST